MISEFYVIGFSILKNEGMVFKLNIISGKRRHQEYLFIKSKNIFSPLIDTNR